MTNPKTPLIATIWRRRFDLLVGLVSLFIVALVLVGFIGLTPAAWSVPGRELVREMIDSAGFASYVGVMELLLVLAALALTAFHFRHQRAAAFIERFNSPEVIAMRGRIDDWLAGYEVSELRKTVRSGARQTSDDERNQLAHLEARLLLELQRDRILDKTVKAFANLFQEVGEAYENRTVSPSYTRRMFDFLAPHYWDLLRFWIDDYRLQGTPTLYARFGTLADAIVESPKKIAGIRRAQQGATDEGNSSSFAIERRAMLAKASQPHRTFVFGYGSLIASRSRQHAAANETVMTAVLHGYARAWNTVEYVKFEGDDEPTPTLFLGLSLSVDGACNGLLVEIDPAELPAMDRREKSYIRLDMTPWIELDEPIANAVIFGYIGRTDSTYDPQRDTHRWKGLVVAGGYRKLIDEGLLEHPAEFADAFGRHTWSVPSGVLTVDKPYRFLDAEQNRATGRAQPDQDGGPARAASKHSAD